MSNPIPAPICPKPIYETIQIRVRDKLKAVPHCIGFENVCRPGDELIIVKGLENVPLRVTVIHETPYLILCRRGERKISLTKAAMLSEQDRLVVAFARTVSRTA